MRRVVGLALVLAVCIVLTGCTSVAPDAKFKASAALTQNGSAVTLNPQSYDVKDIGLIEGEAHVTKLFGFAIEGDHVIPEVSGILGSMSGDIKLSPLTQIAAARAIDNKTGAQGLYIIRDDKEYTNILGVWSRVNVKVKGRGVSLTPVPTK